MPNRIIKESIKRSPEIDRLSWFEEVVFYRLIVTADDYGRLDGRMIVLKNDLFPTKDTITKKAIEDAISKLVSVGLLVAYVDAESNMPYLAFRKWDKHQVVRNKYSRYPAPPEDLLTNCKQSLTDCKQSFENCHYESESNIESESNTESNNAHANDLPAGFDDFWSIYPRKVSKQAAIKAWKAAKIKAELVDTIIEDVKRRCNTEWKDAEIQFIPHPTTYLNQRRWEDETAPVERTNRGERNQSTNPALNYDQRQYTDEDFGDDFFIDLDKYAKGG